MAIEKQRSIERSRVSIARHWSVALLLFFLLLTGGSASRAAALQSDRLAVVTDAGETLVNIAASPGMRWCIAWNHSVKQFTVLDCYQNVAGTMQLKRSHQPDFAAGLGHTVGRGEQVSDGEGGYWINAIDEPVPDNRYLLRVGAEAVNHRVVWQDGNYRREVSLSARAPGQRVTIQLIKSAPPGGNHE